MRLVRFGIHKSPRDLDRAIRLLVRHAYAYTYHYRQLLDDAGVSPSEVLGIDDLPMIPVTTRDRLAKGSWRSIFSDRAAESKCRKTLTSGSTGSLLPVYMTSSESYYRRLLLLLALFENMGRILPLRLAEIGPRPERPPDDLVQRIGLVQVVHLQPDETPTEMDRLLGRFHPHVLTGAPTCLEMLADRWPTADLGPTSLRLIASRGEMLNRPTRERLEGVFNCRVADYYNCEEIGNVAWECPEIPDRMHVNADGCVLEIVDEQGRPVQPGEEGEIVVTNLFNHTMPFIRYSLGDRARFVVQEADRCSCGSRLPMIVAPSGRDEDFFVFSEGQRISPRTIDNAIGHILHAHLASPEMVPRYRIVQEQPNLIRIEAVILGGVRGDLESALQARCREWASDVQCRLDLVETLPEAGPLKFRRVISKVSKGYPRAG